MKLYLISQDENNDYDTYDSAVVAAKDEETARGIHPGNQGGWCSPKAVKVKFLGEAVEGTLEGVICASFNAG